MKLISAILLASVAASASAVAQTRDYPSTGIVYNTKDFAALTHFCKLSADRYSMDCEFTQTSVRRKLDAAEATKKLADAKAEFTSKPEPMDQKKCADFENWWLILQGKKAATDSQALANVSAREKADMTAMFGQIVAFCRAPNLDNWMKIASSGVEKERRTCLISSHTFKQRFRQTETNAWIVVSQPEGPCGVIQLSRFEPEKSSSGSITFWNYFARKAVTNPNGDAGLMQCKDLDEREYKYQWQKRDPDLNCEYVEFSAF